MSDYTAAPATALLATHCLACGRPLLDAVSVEKGMGPVCRKKFLGEDDDEIGLTRDVANKIVKAMAVPGTQAHVILASATDLDALGFSTLAQRLRDRFMPQPKIVLELIDAGELGPDVFPGGPAPRWLLVKTPWNEAFTSELRQKLPLTARLPVYDGQPLPGKPKGTWRGWAVLPEPSLKRLLHELLDKHFPGTWADGPKGPFLLGASHA